MKLLDTEQVGVIKGNLIAMTVLVALIAILTLFSALTVVVPLVLGSASAMRKSRRGAPSAAGAIYFSLIGAGFMLLEMAMMQRLSIFLGHPVYGLGVVLCLIILSTGFGSFLSQCLPLTRTPWVYLYPVVLAATIVAERFVLLALMSGLVTAPMGVKIACSVAAICPVGILLGFCFPTGMRLVRQIECGRDSLVLGPERDFRGAGLRAGRVRVDLQRRQHQLLPRRRLLPARHGMCRGHPPPRPADRRPDRKPDGQLDGPGLKSAPSRQGRDGRTLPPALAVRYSFSRLNSHWGNSRTTSMIGRQNQGV